MASVTLTVSDTMYETIKNYYSDYCIAPPQHAIFSATPKDCRITIYKSGKVLFQGKAAEQEASRWQDVAQKEKKTSHSLPCNFKDLAVIGSDEVGNGSYFGPLVVVAAYVPKSLHPFLLSLHVRDSKTMTDIEMKHIYTEIKDKVMYYPLIVHPKKYNEVQPKYNAVHMKAVLHNRVLARLEEKVKAKGLPVDALLIDEFTSTKSYQNYIKNEHPKPVTQTFSTPKAEGEHLAVAVASIIARVLFLQTLEEESHAVGMTLPSGAGTKSDQVAAQLIQKYGPKVLENVAKLHFANTKKALKLAKS